MRHARRTDRVHAEIRDGLREHSWRVLDMSAAGRGIPDLLVEILPGLSMGLEVKDPSFKDPTKELTWDQRSYHDYMSQTVRVVQTLQEAHDVCMWAARNWRNVYE